MRIKLREFSLKTKLEKAIVSPRINTSLGYQELNYRLPNNNFSAEFSIQGMQGIVLVNDFMVVLRYNPPSKPSIHRANSGALVGNNDIQLTRNATVRLSVNCGSYIKHFLHRSNNDRPVRYYLSMPSLYTKKLGLKLVGKTTAKSRYGNISSRQTNYCDI